MAVSLYWIVQADATATPTGAQIVAGQDGTGATALKSGSEAYTAAADYSEASAITGLSAGTAYEQAWVAYDGSTYSSVATATITTLTSVTVTLSNLTAVNIAATSVQPQLDYTISGTPDSADTTYFAVYPSAASAPTWTLGGGWSGSPTATGSDTGPPATTATDDEPAITWSAALTPGTPYKMYAIWHDGTYTSNSGAALASAEFTTYARVVLSSPTYVPGSITATGARGRVTATEYA